jgi:hypothetical protein
MSDTQVLAIIILLAVGVGLLVLLVLVVTRIARCVQRVERVLERTRGTGDAAVTAPESKPSRQDGEFVAFLQEDPARRQLTKSEQFSAYRRWRRDKGLNWSPP